MKPLVACGGCGLKLHRYGRRVHRFEETTTVYYNKEPEDYPNWDRGNCGSFNGHQKCHEKEEKKNNCYELYAHLKENELSANTSLAFLSELQEYLDSSSSSVTNHCDLRLVT